MSPKARAKRFVKSGLPAVLLILAVSLVAMGFLLVGILAGVVGILFVEPVRAYLRDKRADRKRARQVQGNFRPDKLIAKWGSYLSPGVKLGITFLALAVFVALAWFFATLLGPLLIVVPFLYFVWNTDNRITGGEARWALTFAVIGTYFLFVKLFFAQIFFWGGLLVVAWIWVPAFWERRGLGGYGEVFSLEGGFRFHKDTSRAAKQGRRRTRAAKLLATGFILIALMPVASAKSFGDGEFDYGFGGDNSVFKDINHAARTIYCVGAAGDVSDTKVEWAYEAAKCKAENKIRQVLTNKDCPGGVSVSGECITETQGKQGDILIGGAPEETILRAADDACGVVCERVDAAKGVVESVKRDLLNQGWTVYKQPVTATPPPAKTLQWVPVYQHDGRHYVETCQYADGTKAPTLRNANPNLIQPQDIAGACAIIPPAPSPAESILQNGVCVQLPCTPETKVDLFTPERTAYGACLQLPCDKSNRTSPVDKFVAQVTAGKTPVEQAKWIPELAQDLLRGFDIKQVGNVNMPYKNALNEMMSITFESKTAPDMNTVKGVLDACGSKYEGIVEPQGVTTRYPDGVGSAGVEYTSWIVKFPVKCTGPVKYTVTASTPPVGKSGTVKKDAFIGTFIVPSEAPALTFNGITTGVQRLEKRGAEEVPVLKDGGEVEFAFSVTAPNALSPTDVDELVTLVRTDDSRIGCKPTCEWPVKNGEAHILINKLAAGDYSLQFYAITKDGVRSNEATVSFTVTDPAPQLLVKNSWIKLPVLKPATLNAYHVDYACDRDAVVSFTVLWGDGEEDSRVGKCTTNINSLEQRHAYADYGRYSVKGYMQLVNPDRTQEALTPAVLVKEFRVVVHAEALSPSQPGYGEQVDGMVGICAVGAGGPCNGNEDGDDLIITPDPDKAQGDKQDPVQLPLCQDVGLMQVGKSWVQPACIPSSSAGICLVGAGGPCNGGGYSSIPINGPGGWTADEQSPQPPPDEQVPPAPQGSSTDGSAGDQPGTYEMDASDGEEPATNQSDGGLLNDFSSGLKNAGQGAMGAAANGGFLATNGVTMWVLVGVVVVAAGSIGFWFARKRGLLARFGIHPPAPKVPGMPSGGFLSRFKSKARPPVTPTQPSFTFNVAPKASAPRPPPVEAPRFDDDLDDFASFGNFRKKR